MACRGFVVVVGMIAGVLSSARAGDELPSDAGDLVKQFQQDVAGIQSKANREIGARKEKLVQDLKALRDSYAKEGKFDEAVAVQERIRFLQAERVEVQQGGVWWPAEIRKRQDGKMLVHYLGWDDSWNEWVTPDRIRPLTHRGPWPTK